MKTTLTIKTDKKLRDDAKQAAKELGVPLGTIVNALLQQFVRDKEITLSSKKPQPDLKRSIDELRTGKGERYSTVEELFTATDVE